MRLFGKKKEEAQAPRLGDSIHVLRGALESLDKREKHLEMQRAQCLQAAREKLARKDKRGAMYELKKSKLVEKQIEQITGKKLNVDKQMFALESALGNKEIVNAMRFANEAFKATVKENDIDKVADIMEDINENINLAEELGDALSQPMGQPLDEDELLGELDQLEAEMTEEKLLEVPNVLPARMVPSTTTISSPTTSTVTPSAMSATTTPATTNITPTVSSSTSAPVQVSDDKEARDLRELEALMGM